MTSEFLKQTQCCTPFWFCGSAVAGFSVVEFVTVPERLAAVAAEPVAGPEPAPAAADAAVAFAASGPLGMIQ